MTLRSLTFPIAMLLALNVACGGGSKEDTAETDTDTDTDSDTDGGEVDDGEDVVGQKCGCASGPAPVGFLGLVLAFAMARRRR